MVIKLFILVIPISLLTCVPAPEILDYSTPIAIIAVINAPRGNCLYSGLNKDVAGSGILACNQLDNYYCGTNQYYKFANDRTQITTEINAIGISYSNCLIPSANATTELNTLSLPAQYYLNQAGGTSGPHLSSNHTVELVDSCASIGLDTAIFLNGAKRLSTAEELKFLGSPKGLVAIKDTIGNCRIQMGLTNEQNEIANSYITNQITNSASCDYGVADATKTDCPNSLEDTKYKYSGIINW